MRQLLLDIWRRGSHVIIYGMIPSGILTWQSKFCLQTRKYTLQQVNFPWIVLDCWSVQMLVFSVCFCSGRGKERCAFFSICVTIAIAIPGGFGNFRRFTFGFLYQTWGFDPFHNRFVGKKMWGSPTQKRFRKKKKTQLERLDIYIFTKSYNVRLIHKYDWTWRVMMTKQSKKMSTKSGNKKNNTGNETRKGLKLRFTIDSPWFTPPHKPL